MPLECPPLQTGHPCNTRAAEIAKNDVADLLLTSASTSKMKFKMTFKAKAQNPGSDLTIHRLFTGCMFLHVRE
jgi:hypothetical protein